MGGEVRHVSDLDFAHQAREWSPAGLLEFVALSRGVLRCCYKSRFGTLQLVNAHMNVGVDARGRLEGRLDECELAGTLINWRDVVQPKSADLHRIAVGARPALRFHSALGSAAHARFEAS